MFGGEHALLGAAGALGILAANFFALVPGGAHGFALAQLQSSEKTFAGDLPVHELGTRVLNGDGNVGGEMAQGDARGNFVDVLAARPGGAAEDFLQLGFVQGSDGLHIFESDLRGRRNIDKRWTGRRQAGERFNSQIIGFKKLTQAGKINSTADERK